MATIQDLFTALHRADEAGNTEDAKRIAEIIHGLGYGERPAAPKEEAPKKRSMTEAATDVLSSFGSGVGQFAQLPGQIGTLAGIYGPEEQNTGLQGLGKELQQFSESKKTDILKQKEAARAQKIQQADGFLNEAKAAISSTITDPALLTSFFAEQVPNLIGSFGFGAVTKGGTKLLMRNATEQALQKAGVRGAIGGGAIMQGADIGSDTYEETLARLKKNDPNIDPAKANELALSAGRKAAIEAAALSLGVSKLPGGATIERALAGRNLPGAAGFVRGTLGETFGEGIEEGGGALAKNLAMAEVVPGVDIGKGVGAATGLGALGGAMMGAPASLVSGAPLQEPAPTLPQVRPRPAAAPEGLATLPTTGGGFDAGQAAALRAQAEQAEQDRLAGVEAGRLAEEAAAQEAVRGMPGFAGTPDINAELLGLTRADRAEEQKRLEAERRAQIKQIENTQFSTDPFQDQIMRNRALQQISPAPQAEPVAAPKAVDPLAELTQEIPELPTYKPKAPPKTVPMSEEDMEAVKTYKQDLATVEKQLTEAKKGSTDLFKRLDGAMSYQDVLEVAPEVGNKYRSRDADTAKKVDKYKKLVDKTGKARSLSSMVADGELNEYLPPKMRLGSPTFDEATAVQHIYDKLASGDTRSFDESQAMKALEDQRATLQELINDPQRRADLNYQAQAAAAQQRGVEPLPFGDLIADAQGRGVDTDAVMERVAMQMPPDATPAQYQGEVRNQIDNEIAAKEGRVAGAPPAEEKLDLSQPQYMKRNATPDQVNNAELHAQDFGGRVPYQNGDIGLIQAFNGAGNYVYLPFEGKTRYRKDVDALESSHFTPKQIKELRDAKAKLVKVEKARKNKLVKFDKNGIGISPDLDDRIVGVVSEWKKMLGIEGNVYITTMDFSRRNAFEYAGPYTKIGAAALDQNNSGIVQKLSNGEYYIAFKEKPSVMRVLETLAHEMGHIHQYEVYDNAPKHLKDMVQKEYEKWLVSQKGKTAKELVLSLRARKAGKEATSKVRPDLMASEVGAYWRSFSEWYADQVSRWATTQEKPLTAVEKFFKRIGTALKNFYRMLKGQEYLPTETFKQYLDQVSATAMPDVIESAQDQMPLFMRETAPQRTQLGNDTMEMLAGIGRTVAEPEPGYTQKITEGWKNVRDNPQATRDAAYSKFRRFLDQAETWTFSSDAGLNNQIRNGIMNSMAGQEQKIGMLLNTSLSQTAHSDAVSNLFIMEGNIKYDTDLHKWVGVKDENNIINLSKKLDEIAEKLGLNKQEVELMAHTAFEARRAQELNRFNEQIERQAAAIKEQAKIDRAEGRSVAASALNEKANNLLRKKKIVMEEDGGHVTRETLETGLRLYDMHPGLKEVTKIWNGIRQNALDRMVETGLYTEKEAAMLMSAADYVPFFREDQIEEGKGPKEFLRSLAVQADKRLKGSNKPVNDIFDNMVRWTQYAINRGVRNRSGVALAQTAEQMGLATKINNPSNPNNIGMGGVTLGDGGTAFATAQQASQYREQNNLQSYNVLEVKDDDGKSSYFLTPYVEEKNVAKVWENGKQVEYAMEDPLFVEAFRGLESVAIPTVKFFSKFADVLRQSVVLYPLFSLAQVPQDSFAAMFTSGLKPQHALSIPVRAMKEFIQTLRGKSKAHEILKNVGAVGVRDFTSAIIRADAEIAAGLKEDKTLWGNVKRKLGNWAMAADNAVRQATYEAAKAQGLSDAEAIEKAFEIFNVRRRGSSKMLALSGQVIPFFNAYLAAQHVAYRTLTGVGTSPTERKAALQTLAATTGSVMALSVLYAMMNGDDEDYLNKPTPTRDRLLMIPGTGVSIPLRSDIFALPKVLAEHTYLLMTDNGYEDPAKFRASVASLLANSFLSPTTVPQAVKPLIEVGINYDFFQEKPLVGVFQQRRDLDKQFENSTSEFSKALAKVPLTYNFTKGQWEGLSSPIGLDHMIRGMLGSFGGLFLYATNPILADMSGTPRPALTYKDALATIPNASTFITKEYEVGLRKDFYALKEATDKVGGTLSYMKQNSPQEIADYLSDETVRARYALTPAVNQIAQQLTTIRNAVTAISQAPEERMTEDEKQEKIKQLREAELQVLKGVNLKALRERAKL